MGSCFINFRSDLAESWRVESSEAFIKPNLCTSDTFHACPCSGFHLDDCSTLQWGYIHRAAKASAWYGVWSSPYEHLYFHWCDAGFWQWWFADNMILLLVGDCQIFWLSCSEYEVFSDYFKQFMKWSLRNPCYGVGSFKKSVRAVLQMYYRRTHLKEELNLMFHTIKVWNFLS